MRRAMGLALVGLGATAIVAAPLTLAYAAPRLAKAPLGTYAVAEAVSDGQSVMLDKATLKIRTGLTLRTVRRIEGDAAAGNGQNAVWNQFAYTKDPDGVVVQAALERIPFDRVTGMAANCCGSATDGNPLSRTGLYLKFPFGTGQKDYPFWDADTGRAWPAAYQGEEQRFGLTLYRFSQKVPATKVENLGVPATLVNAPGNGAVMVDRYVESTTDFAVEPVTGVIISATGHSIQTLRDASGGTLATVADVTSSLTEKTQQDSAAQARQGVTELWLLRTIVPAAALLLGIAAVYLGLVLLGALRPVRVALRFGMRTPLRRVGVLSRGQSEKLPAPEQEEVS